MRRLAPSAPTNFAVAVGATDIVLSWEAPETGAADGYNVEYGKQDSEELATQQLTAEQTSYTHADSVEGVTYQYRVQAPQHSRRKPVVRDPDRQPHVGPAGAHQPDGRS